MVTEPTTNAAYVRLPHASKRTPVTITSAVTEGVSPSTVAPHSTRVSATDRREATSASTRQSRPPSASTPKCAARKKNPDKKKRVRKTTTVRYRPVARAGSNRAAKVRFARFGHPPAARVLA